MGKTGAENYHNNLFILIGTVNTKLINSLTISFQVSKELVQGFRTFIGLFCEVYPFGKTEIEIHSDSWSILLA